MHFVFLFSFSYQRPIVPALYVSTPLVITSHSHTHHVHRRSLHLPQSHPLTPPITVPSLTGNSSKMCSTVSHMIDTNSNPTSPRHKPLTLSHSHPLSHSTPLTAPPLSQFSPADHNSKTSHFAFDFTYSSPVPEETLAPSSPPGPNARSSTSPMKVTGPAGVPLNNTRSSDSDLSTPPKGTPYTTYNAQISIVLVSSLFQHFLRHNVIFWQSVHPNDVS